MEFYEEALSLVFDLTSKKISPDLWKVLEMIYQVILYILCRNKSLMSSLSLFLLSVRCLRRMPLIILRT